MHPAGGAADVSPANPLYRFERSMGVVQHHDAVSGHECAVMETRETGMLRVCDKGG